MSDDEKPLEPIPFGRRQTAVLAMRYDGPQAPNFGALMLWLEGHTCPAKLLDDDSLHIRGHASRDIYPSPGCWIIHEAQGSFTALSEPQFVAAYMRLEMDPVS